MTGKKPSGNQFYLGKLFDPVDETLQKDRLLYKPSNLNTHAIVTGMTGSGKTGLCIAMLEEAALQNIPAIVVDPKGDLTNLLLHFPDLAPADFEPWLDPEQARQKGQDLDQLAAKTAETWRSGLEEWGLGRTELLALQKQVRFTIYTPGSTSGKPVNILSSFEAPQIPWDDHREVLREKIAAIVTALLGLIGLKDIDPLRSREHILLANLLETAWSSGRSLDLSELILQIQKPPFERLGAFPLENFFSAKDRMDLALLLNNFLAAPSFQTWQEGQPLDVQELLFEADGRPRHSVFYLAHLSENERMFFVTLLFAAVEAWMRAQRGTSSLRALLYFDEIMGYLPATSKPPSHTILLRMLKQARAFGVGLLLATQNPVDVDYKALSNAGTWLIGRLQTERDKERLMDGLRSAGGSFNTAQYNKLISGLRKRVFILHSVHASEPQIFHTRWVLNYLAGPMTRTQIPALNKLADSAAAVTQEEVSPKADLVSAAAGPAVVAATRIPAAEEKPDDLPYSTTRPSLPAGLSDFFLPTDQGIKEALNEARISLPASVQPDNMLYRPCLFAQSEIRYYNRTYNISLSRTAAALITQLAGSLVTWEDQVWKTYDKNKVDNRPLPQALFAPLPGWLMDKRQMDALKKDFVDWVYRAAVITVRSNKPLKVYAGPDINEAEFEKLCLEAAQTKMDVEIKKVETSYNRKLTALERKITRQQAEVLEQEDEVDQRKLEEMGTHGELLLSVFSKRRRSLTTSLTKRRMTQQAKADMKQEIQELEMLEKDLSDLEEEKNEQFKAIEEKWQDIAAQVDEIPLNPFKKDIHLTLFGVGWQPFYLVKTKDETLELQAFEAGTSEA
jgi:hypothetical protein